MIETASAPALVSVIVLKIQDFTRRPVAEQARLKAQIEALVAATIQPLPAAGRIVLDTPDGITVAAFGAPEGALEFAERAQSAALDLPLCIGINHGPVRPAPDAQREAGLIGDGLAAAATVAAAAVPGRLLASRSFHEALARSAPDRAEDLGPAGTLTDASVRTHQIYQLDRRPALTRRRRLIAASAVTVFSILGLGILGRNIRLTLASRPAIILFQITPHGDIVIDGVMRGRSPPLMRLDVSPGSHMIEVRNSSYPPLTLEVNLRSQEEMTMRHTFTKPKPKPKRKRDDERQREEGVIDRWRRKLGL